MIFELINKYFREAVDMTARQRALESKIDSFVTWLIMIFVFAGALFVVFMEISKLMATKGF